MHVSHKSSTGMFMLPYLLNKNPHIMPQETIIHILKTKTRLKLMINGNVSILLQRKQLLLFGLYLKKYK